jgi:hypothetical protein
LWDTTEEKKTPALWDTTEGNLSNVLRSFLLISHNEGKLLLLYPTKEENIFHCSPQRRKTSPVVSDNGGKPSLLYPTTAKKLKTLITTPKFVSAKLFLPMNQGPRLSSLMKKIFGQKSRATVPLRKIAANKVISHVT